MRLLIGSEQVVEDINVNFFIKLVYCFLVERGVLNELQSSRVWGIEKVRVLVSEGSYRQDVFESRLGLFESMSYMNDVV